MAAFIGHFCWGFDVSEMGSKIASPCVSLCCLDEDDVCMGCLRHINEITGWHGMNDNEKRELLVVLEQRRDETDPPKYK